MGPNMPIDVKRMRIRQAAGLGAAEQEALPNEQGTPPGDSAWRYRRDGVPRVFAVLGVAVGFAALIVPGVFALASYRRWRRGVQAEPTLPWSLGIIALVAIPVVPLFMSLPIAAVGLAILLGLPLLVLVGPRH